MLLFWRKFLFYILLAAYFAVTPFAVLYALGYNLGPQQGEFFNKTGLLSIESEPRGARVFVNGKRFSESTPAVVRDLLPGDYQVEVVKKGYDRWAKKITVQFEKASRLQPVMLPLNFPAETVSQRPYRFFLPLMLDFRVFGLTTTQLDSLKSTDIFLKRTYDTGEKTGLDQHYEVLSFLTKTGSGLALFKVQEGGKISWQALQLNREKEARNLSEFIPNNSDLIDWDEKASRYIYFQSEGTLSAVDWRKGKILPGLISDVLGFGVKGGRLYALKKDWTLLVSGAKPENLKWESVENTVPRPENAGQIKKVQIEVFKREFFQKDLLLFLTDDGKLLSSRPPYILADQKVRGFQYASSEEDEKILFWTDSQLYALQLPRETEDVPPLSAAPVLLTDRAADIRQAFWAYNHTHALYLDGARIFLAEVSAQEPFYIRPLGAVLPDSPVFFHDLTQTVYFLDSETRQLMRRKITE